VWGGGGGGVHAVEMVGGGRQRWTAHVVGVTAARLRWRREPAMVRAVRAGEVARARERADMGAYDNSAGWCGG
jgi:hypothetical protein